MQVGSDVIMPSHKRPTPARILAENLAFALAEVGVSLDRLAKVARIPSERLEEIRAGAGDAATPAELELIAMALGREDGGELLAAHLAPLPIARVERVRERFDRVAPPPPVPAGRGKTGPRFEHMSPAERQNFAGNLRVRRKAFGWSGAEFATRCGVWQPTVARWEDGEDTRAIKPENLQRIAEVFGCSVADLTAEPPALHSLPRVAPADIQVREGAVFFSLPPGIGPEQLPDLEREVRALVSRFTQNDLDAAREKYRPKPPSRPPRR